VTGNVCPVPYPHFWDALGRIVQVSDSAEELVRTTVPDQSDGGEFVMIASPWQPGSEGHPFVRYWIEFEYHGGELVRGGGLRPGPNVVVGVGVRTAGGVAKAVAMATYWFIREYPDRTIWQVGTSRVEEGDETRPDSSEDLLDYAEVA
jgi:hypothetical protein